MQHKKADVFVPQFGKRRSLPFDTDVWGEVLRILKLAPQQARIVELLMRGFQDKEIAAELNISKSTLRTYLSRMFARYGARDRMAMVLHVVQVASNASNDGASREE